FGQTQVVVPRDVESAKFSLRQGDWDPERLAKLFQDGQWAGLYETTDALLTKTMGAGFAPPTKYYGVVFIAKGYRTDFQVIRYYVHKFDSHYRDESLTSLPGLAPTSDALWEIVLTNAAAVVDPKSLGERPLHSTYAFTRVENPLVAQG